MSKADYTQIHGNFYGVIKLKNGETETVPFLQFERKSNKQRCRIPVDAFHSLTADGYGYKDILEGHAQWYKKLISNAKAKEHDKAQVRIHSLQEYVDFLFTIMPSDIVEDIKEHYADCKSLKEITELFPEIYRGLIRLRYEYDINGDKRFNIKALQKPVAKQMTLEKEQRSYNPNAFTEPEGT